mmetsp:Transcript_59789/g.141437  ORF Transcript_59789/g.141437 Transcript_59789/m.141437 type:complete len:111 (-) Transcript_59789:899-1231(-)
MTKRSEPEDGKGFEDRAYDAIKGLLAEAGKEAATQVFKGMQRAKDEHTLGAKAESTREMLRKVSFPKPLEALVDTVEWVEDHHERVDYHVAYSQALEIRGRRFSMRSCVI